VRSEHDNSEQGRADQIEEKVGIGLITGPMELQEGECPQDQDSTKHLQHFAHKNLHLGQSHCAPFSFPRGGNLPTHVTDTTRHKEKR
jgi:hypothetical protein